MLHVSLAQYLHLIEIEVQQNSQPNQLVLSPFLHTKMYLYICSWCAPGQQTTQDHSHSQLSLFEKNWIRKTGSDTVVSLS